MYFVLLWALKLADVLLLIFFLRLLILILILFQLVNYVLFEFSGDELKREDLGAGEELYQGMLIVDAFRV